MMRSRAVLGFTLLILSGAALCASIGRGVLIGYTVGVIYTLASAAFICALIEEPE